MTLTRLGTHAIIKDAKGDIVGTVPLRSGKDGRYSFDIGPSPSGDYSTEIPVDDLSQLNQLISQFLHWITTKPHRSRLTTINVDPINTAPYFVPIGGGEETFAQSNQGNYFLISGMVRDPNFQRGHQVELTVTTQDGTLVCHDLIEKVNAFFYQKTPSGIIFYPRPRISL